MSVDPYMRGRMNDRKSYVPPFEIGKALMGGAVGEVVGSGELVVHQKGWREHALVKRDAGTARSIGWRASRRRRCSALWGCRG